MKLSEQLKEELSKINDVEKIDILSREEIMKNLIPKVEAMENVIEELLSQGVCARYHPSCHIKCRINFDNKDCAVVKAKETL
jgi:hypothetical protein